MTRPRMFRLLRIAVSAVFGILCLIAIVLWIRSYRSVDVVFGCVFETRPFKITSEQGRLNMVISNVSRGRGGAWGAFSYYLDRPMLGAPPKMGVTTTPSNRSIALPYCLVVSLSGAATSLLCRAGCLRFSLRTLLLATTLVAVVLGLVMAMR